MLLNHPGQCLGYRVEYGGRVVCYVTDNELYPVGYGLRDDGYFDRLVSFVEGAGVLITDSTYSDVEYLEHVGWGHSCVGEVVSLAHRAGVETLYLVHHDPGQDDGDIVCKLEAAQALLVSLGSKTKCVAPCEGDVVVL